MKEKIYIFIREGGFFYDIILKDDTDAIENAKCNPGTIRVEDLFGGIVWEKSNDKLK